MQVRPQEDYEFTLLRGVMTTVVLCGCVSIPSNYFANLSPQLNVALFLLVLFNLTLLWLTRKPRDFQTLRWAAILGNSFMLSPIWFLNGGLLGSIPSFSYCLNIALICVYDGYHYQLLAGLVGLVFCNIAVEMTFPGLVTNYPDRDTHFADVGLAVIEGNVLFGILAIQIKRRLQRALQELAKNNRELESTLSDLQESQHREREHLQLICHDLRNPVAAILSCIDLSVDQIGQLPQDNVAVEELRDNLNTIELCSNRSLELIEMLSLAQFLEQGATRADLEFDLGKSWEHALTVAGARARQKSQTLEFHCGEAIGPGYNFYGSQQLLTLVWQNILDNAIKYSPRGSRVSVYLKRASTPHQLDRFQIDVVDQGQGLRPDELSVLFRKFGRASSVPTDGESCTGLGLYICKKIVELHGGQISATSLGLDQGLTISVELPVRSKIDQSKPS
jgi:signal transduction histidine kinase